MIASRSTLSALPPLSLRQLGQYDAAFEATVEPDGAWRTDGGSYVTRSAQGVLSRRAHRELATLAQAIDLGVHHPQPDAEGFTSELAIGDRVLAWWGPPPTDALRTLVNAFARLGR